MLDILTFIAEFNARKYAPKEYKRNYSAEFIEAARQRILIVKPWEKSTGPRTPGGKSKVSQNNFKHGRRSIVMQMVGRVVSQVSKDVKKER